MNSNKKQLKSLLILALGLLIASACATGGKEDLGSSQEKALIGGTAAADTTGIVKVTSFGTNPGGLNMYKYAPAGIAANAPLVVVLHGCQQTAASYARDTQWNKLADRFKFYVVYGEEVSGNNPYTCFRFYDTGQNARGKGEALSIKQMVDKMKADYSIDSKKVYITGLSAGAAMSLVMLLSYPDVFAAGGVNASIPYKCEDDATGIMNKCMKGQTTRTASDYAARAKTAYAGYTGAYPKLMALQGTADQYVYPHNLGEVVKQWTGVFGADQTADVTGTLKGHTMAVYTQDNTANGPIVIKTVEIKDMQHGVSVDPGNGEDQGGEIAPYNIMGQTMYFTFDKDLYSSYYIAQFFNILDKAPVAEITSPANGANVSGNVEIKASLSSESSEMTQVELRIGGELKETKAISGLSYNYTYLWDVNQEAFGGNVTLEVTVYTAKTSVKKSITVNVDKPVRITASADKESGTYQGSSLSVVLTSSRPSTIYYTTNGSEPTLSSASIASGSAITLTAQNGAKTTYIVKFFAKESSGQTSVVVSKEYSINPQNYSQVQNGTCIDHLSAGRIAPAKYMTYYAKYSYNTKFDMYLLNDNVAYTPQSGTRWADKQIDAAAWN